MNTLVVRHVPDGLYRRLEAVAAAHRRSMNQEAILALEAGLPGGGLQRSARALRKQGAGWSSWGGRCRCSIIARLTRSLAMAMTASVPDASLAIDLVVDSSAVIAVARVQQT